MTNKRGVLAAQAVRLRSVFSPLQLFALFAPKDSARVVTKDARYADGPRHGLDAYAPLKADGPAPVAIFFYGGSWETGRRQEYGWVARALAAQGFLTVVPDYRVYPDVVFPDFLDDCAKAVRWAVDHAAELGGDPGRIVLVGHSAGAYNAAMLALDSRWLRSAGVEPGVIRAIAGLSGPYSFLPLESPITRRTFGAETDLEATQPVRYARADAPAAFLATGAADTLVRPRQTRRLTAALRDAGVTVEEHHYDGMGHAGPVLAFARPFRRKSTLFADMVRFLKSAVDHT